MLNNSKKILFLFSIVTAFLFLQGCAAPKVNLTNQDRTQLKKLKSVKAFHMYPGWPTLKTPLGVIASDLTLGFSEDWTEGQKLVKKFKIKNPSMLIKREFIKQVNYRKKAANFVDVRKQLAYKDSEIEAMKKNTKRVLC